MKNKKGIFIVIDGTDGSGKGTQTKLLVERLERHGYGVEMADFPQYKEKSAGLVENYLNGKYGKADEVGPYCASIFYAVDRYDASFKIKKWLREGKIVISNRYVTANMGHQGGKITDPQERREYFSWLYNLEYKIFNIPRPDLNIILHVDAITAQKMVDKKEARDYINGQKRDMHEKDTNHLLHAEQTYLDIAKQFNDIELIECSRNNEIMSKKEINDLLWKKIKNHIDNPPAEIAPNFLILQEHSKIAKENSLNAKNDKEPETIKFEKITKNAVLPTRAYKHDVGFDLYATDYYTLLPGERAGIHTGLKLALPPGYAGLIWDRGSSAKNGIHTLGGVFDPGYRGEMIIHLINLSGSVFQIIPGRKIAQLLIQKIVTPRILETTLDDNTQRGQRGHGSSGL